MPWADRGAVRNRCCAASFDTDHTAKAFRESMTGPCRRSNHRPPVHAWSTHQSSGLRPTTISWSSTIIARSPHRPHVPAPPLETFAKPVDIPAGVVELGDGRVRLQLTRGTRRGRGCLRGAGRLTGLNCSKRPWVCELGPPARGTDRLPAHTRIWRNDGGKSSDMGPLA